MERKDVHWTPQNDIVELDLPLVADHKKLIDAEKYKEATRLLNAKEYFDKGMRAVFFNELEKRLAICQEYLRPDNPNRKKDRVLTDAISFTEPTDPVIEHWDRPYDVPLGLSYTMPDLVTYVAPNYGAEGEYPWL